VVTHRLLFVGISGSGKSSWARRAAQALGVPHYELDATFHQPGWTPLPTDEFRRRVSEIVAAPQWTIDGNYSAVRDLTMQRCTAMIAFDFPRRVVMRQVIVRTIRRALTRQVLWNGNREDWRNIFRWDPELSIIRWSWTKWAERHAEIDTFEAQAAEGGFACVRVHSHREVRDALRALGVPVS